MDEELNIIKKAGLSESQAKIYLALLRNGALTPAQMSELTGEKRENCYNIAKRLEELDLIEKTKDKKTSYRVQNPTNLEILAENRRKHIQKNEQYVKNNMSALLDIFYANNYAPGSRTIEGMDGIKEAYKDALRVKKDVYLIRTQADIQIGSDDDMNSFLHKYREQLPKLGIHTYAITPDTKKAREKVKNGRDKEINFHRTFMPEDAYTADVAIHIYGDKVAFIQFGEMPMTSIIESPLIAAAMKQLHGLLIEYFQKTYAPNTDL
jgi:sugar-specific transcriptional regulator TrmB